MSQIYTMSQSNTNRRRKSPEYQIDVYLRIKWTANDGRVLMYLSDH